MSNRNSKINNRKLLLAVTVAGLISACVIGRAHAQVVGAPGVGGYTGDTLSLLSPKPMAERSLRHKPTREYNGLPIAGWMLYPSFLASASFDDNLFLSSTNRVSAVGMRLRPNIIADRDAGIHHTTVYANGDFRIFPDQSTGNTVNAQTGVDHVWEAQRDLTFRVNGEYDRRTDMFNNGFVVTPFGNAGTIASPQRYNQFSGSVSGLKSFDRIFVGLGATVVGTTYDTLFTTTGPVSQGFRDGVVYAVTGRLGYSITPLLYAFSESTGNFREFSSSVFNSDGYRTVAGLGADRIGLFRGEVYAGYQRQLYDSPLFASQSSPVYGGKLYWYPTRAWTVTASLDETFQDSGLTTVGNPTGSAARVTSALVNVNYAMSRSWSASVRGGYDDLAYINGGRHDNRWNAGAQLNYEILRNLNATFEYSFVSVLSNVVEGSFTRNQFTLGGTYKY